MKSVHNPASREITSIEYVPGLKNIVVTAWDGAIYLYDETDSEEIPLIKKMTAHKDEITSAAFSENLSLFVTGAADGRIFLWDYQAHVQVGELAGHKIAISALTFLDPYPIVVSADSQGNICFWLVRPIILQVGKCILRIINYGKGSKSSKRENIPMPALAFWETDTDARLYGADVSGVIKVWDITKALQRWGFAPFGPSKARTGTRGGARPQKPRQRVVTKETAENRGKISQYSCRSTALVFPFLSSPGVSVSLFLRSCEDLFSTAAFRAFFAHYGLFTYRCEERGRGRISKIVVCTFAVPCER